MDWPTDVDNRINYGIAVGKDRGFIHKGDLLVIITGWRKGNADMWCCLVLQITGR